MAATLHLLILAVVIATASASLAPSPSPVESPVVLRGGRTYYHRIANNGRSVDFIEETCKLTKRQSKVCMEVFNADPTNRNANPHQLAAVALRLAASKGTENIGYIASLAPQFATEPKLQQCLTDCTEQYQDAVKQIKDAEVALENAGYLDAVTWVKAAMTDVKMCQAGCKQVAGHKNVLTKKNGDVNRLCSISISIINSL